MRGQTLFWMKCPLALSWRLKARGATIRTIVTALELDFAARLTASYHDIFEAVRRTYQLPFEDMTFAAFAARHIDLHACHLT